MQQCSVGAVVASAIHSTAHAGRGSLSYAGIVTARVTILRTNNQIRIMDEVQQVCKAPKCDSLTAGAIDLRPAGRAEQTGLHPRSFS